MDLYSSGDIHSDFIKCEQIRIEREDFWRTRRILNGRMDSPEHSSRAARLNKIVREKSFFLELFPDGFAHALTFVHPYRSDRESRRGASGVQ